MTKIVFMHVPKAAGSSVNDLFTRLLGESRVRTHIETPLATGESLESIVSGADYISGHFRVDTVKRIREICDNDIVAFTLVRDPIKQLVSHLRWIDHYNQPSERPAWKFLGQITEIVERLDAVNFDDPYSIDEFLIHLPLIGIKLLDNYQSRHFIDNEVLRRLSFAELPQIQKSIASEFEIIGTVDNANKVLKSVCKRSGLDFVDIGHSNHSPNMRTIDASQPWMKEILTPPTRIDSWLYSCIQKIS